MDVIRSLMMTFSIYSKIPMPNVEWKEGNMKYTMCFFPLVGIVHGFLWILWWTVSTRISDEALFCTLTSAALPFLLDGGIHFDGFLDTCDALHSYGDREKKLEILKDPHIGAFAVIYGIIYILLWVSAVSLIKTRDLWMCGAVFCAARALSGVTFVRFKGAKKEGMQFTVSKAAENVPVQITSGLYLVLSFVFFAITSPLTALALLIAGIGMTLLYRHTAYKNFGGITGDTAGWFLEWTILIMFLVIGLI